MQASTQTHKDEYNAENAHQYNTGAKHALGQRSSGPASDMQLLPWETGSPVELYCTPHSNTPPKKFDCISIQYIYHKASTGHAKSWACIAMQPLTQGTSFDSLSGQSGATQLSGSQSLTAVANSSAKVPTAGHHTVVHASTLSKGSRPNLPEYGQSGRGSSKQGL